MFQKDLRNSLEQSIQAVNTDFAMSSIWAIAALIQELQQILPFSLGYINSSYGRNDSSGSMENQISKQNNRVR